MVVTKDGQSLVKKVKIDESMYEEEDRISDLQDCLLIDIISRLDSTKEAIRTGTLSKRWQYLWPHVHNLVFVDNTFPGLDNYVSLVDNTLAQCRQSNLNKFQIRCSYNVQFESQFSNWIRYAVNCNVKELDIMLWKSHSPEFVLDQFIFISSCFTHLKLGRWCVFNPTGAICWSNLKSLSLTGVDNLTEDLIENILSGSPLLETLELMDCFGFWCIDITSKSVKNLVFSGYSDPERDFEEPEDIIEINAPYIVSLTITDDLWLSNLSLVDVSCLVDAHLDYKKFGHYLPSREVSHEETLKGLLLSLCHVKELKLGLACLKVLFRLEAKGFIFPSKLEVVDSPLSYSTDELADRSDRDSNESGDSERIVEQVLGRKLGDVASTTCAQSQEPIYTQNQVDAMFEAQNKVIATQSSQFSTLVRALIKSGFPVPASIVPENMNEENEEKDGEDENDK